MVNYMCKKYVEIQIIRSYTRIYQTTDFIISDRDPDA